MYVTVARWWLTVLTVIDVHEGAESPAIGAVATISGVFSTFGTYTSDFSERLKRQPTLDASLAAKTKSPPSTQEAGEVKNKNLSPGQLESMAYRMAAKQYEEDLRDHFKKPATNPKLAMVQARIAAKKAKRARSHQIVSATAHYVGDLSKLGLRGKSRKRL